MIDNPGDSFTLEDIIREFGGRQTDAGGEALPDGVSLSDIEQELRELLGPDEAEAPGPAPEDLFVPEEIPAILYTLLELGEGDAPGDRGEGASIERTPQNPEIKKP